MFPRQQMRNMPTLLSLCEQKVKSLVIEFLEGCPYHFKANYGHYRRMIKRSLTPDMRAQILSQIFVYDENDKIWSFSCLASETRIKCRQHIECKLLYKRSPQILRLLFCDDIPKLKVNLKKVCPNDLKPIMMRVIKVTREACYSRLTELVLSGGTVYTDDLLKPIEKLCYYLRVRTVKLLKLHLPVGSNEVLVECSKMDSLVALIIDRTRQFNYNGLRQLCHRDAFSRVNLKILHIGIFRHHRFSKLDVSKFLSKMANLTSFSLLDEDRLLFSEDKHGAYGVKIMTYSALKLAIVDRAFRKKHDSSFQSHFTELKVVDRKLNPDYVMQACPQLTNLAIDWQEELSYQPYELYEPNWFHDMIFTPDWIHLCKSLTTLSLTLPASHSDGYNLPLRDFHRLLLGITNLKSLTLKGMVTHMPVNLKQLLEAGPNLEELILDKCFIILPFYNTTNPFEHAKMKKLHLLNDSQSLVFHDFLSACMANFMPNLTELIMRPVSVKSCGGLKLQQMRQLAAFKFLNKLSLPISMDEAICNMPEVVYVLREFPALRYLTISWGTCPELTGSRVFNLIHWLKDTLHAENANINVQICNYMHSNLQY